MKRSLYRQPLLLVWGVAALFIVLLALALAALLRAGEREARAQIDRRASQLVAETEAELNRTLLGADLTLGSLPALLAPAFDGQGRLDAARAHALLLDLNERQLNFNDISLYDEAGRSLAGGLPASHGRGADLPPGLVQQVKAQALPQLLVSGPLVGAISGERSLLLLRSVRLPDGQRALAVGEVPVALLAPTFSDNRAGPGALVTLERDDGQLLASVPPNDTLAGQRLRPVLSLDRADGQPRAAASRLDGTAAVQAVRPLLYRDLRLSINLPLAEGLAAWQRNRRAILAAAGAFALLVGAVAVLAQGQLLRLARARADMARSAATLDQALAAMADGFLLCDADDRVLRWNGRYLGMFPWLKAVLAPGVPFRHLAEAAARDATAGGDAQAQAAWVEMRVRAHSEGNRAWEQVLGNGMAVHATERRMPDGGVVSIYRDISAEERRLTRAKADADAANEAKSQFLANISHEIRTPLNAVLGLNELLLDSPLTPTQRQHVLLVRSSGQLLLTLINDILDLARIEAGRIDLRAEAFDPAAVAREVAALLQERAAAKGLQFNLVVAEDVAAQLQGDAMRIRQVCFNLVGNALKFTDAGSVVLSLAQTRDAADEPVLLLTVRDTGVGIEPGAMAQLFDRFSQADNTHARRHGGSGLGLAITREIVRAMGGDIAVDSHPGQGSTFTARMPCRWPAPAVVAWPDAAADPAAQAAARSIPPDAVRPTAPTLRPLHVLVAEDNPVNQVLIEAVLTRQGHRVELVAHGRLALERAQAGDHDLILMDMQMPVLDGLAATRAIRALPGPAARLPIVAMTANARSIDRRACLDAGMDDYVAKPIDVPALQAAMQRALDAAAARTA